jgi:hypothetical protein
VWFFEAIVPHLLVTSQVETGDALLPLPALESKRAHLSRLGEYSGALSNRLQDKQGQQRLGTRGGLFKAGQGYVVGGSRQLVNIRD